MDDPVFVAPLHLAGDGRRLYDDALLAVVEGGKLVGVVERTSMLAAPGDAPIANLMRAPIAVLPTMSLVEAASAISAATTEDEQLSSSEGPWPVVDAVGNLIGTFRQ
jgi:CBS domain-containing protein